MATSMTSTQLYCSKCRKTMSEANFYTYKNGTKAELCKGCLTMHINNWEPETFTWLLEKFDVPYIPAEWNVLRDRAYQKDPYKMNGMSVFGKYLSKMKLKQWSKYGWADTERLQKEAEEQAKLHGNPNQITEEKMKEMEEAYHNGEITEAQWMTYKEVNKPEPEFQIADGAITTAGPGQKGGKPASAGIFPANDSPYEQIDLPDVGNDLTIEDKIYLATKWGQLYTPADWVYLETKYNDFMNSFDIQGAARVDTLIQICKLSLKMNQALDTGDMDSYAKLVRAYDSLMKSAKFTEAQNKDADSADFDAIGCIVAFCEKEGGFLEDYEIKTDRDVIDTIIRDNHDYLDTLWHNDTNLSQQIEQFMKKLDILAEQKADKKKAKEKGQSRVELNDNDYQSYLATIQAEKEQDKALIEQESENEN